MPLRSFTQAEMILAERQRLERPLLGLIWLSVCTVCLAEGKFFYVVAASLAVGLNLLATLRAKEIYVRRLFVNMGVMVAVVIVVMELLGASRNEVTDLFALCHFVILILLCKLFERKTNRDYVQMLALSMLLVVAVALTTVEMWYAIMSVLYLLLLCYTGMIFTLKRGLDAVAGAVLASETSPPEATQVAWNVARDWPGGAMRRKIATSVAAILVMSLLSFLLFPRQPGGSGIPSLAGGRLDSETGFNDQVNLDHAEDLYISNRLVMYVRLRGQPPGEGCYLRAKTFENYAGSKWSAPDNPTYIRLPDLPVEGAIVQEILADPSLLPSGFFGMYPMLRVETPPPEAQKLVDQNLNWSITGHFPEGKWVGYTVWSWPLPLGASQRRQIRRLQPRVSPPPNRLKIAQEAQATTPVRELARQWRDELVASDQNLATPSDAGDLVLARWIADKLKARCTYSLQFEAPDSDQDGVEGFLFQTKQGHCEYFASAMTVMCRSLGIRARLATGFHFDQSNLHGQDYRVLGRDAHAWTEVYTPSTDWVIVDATGVAGPPKAPSKWWAAVLGPWLSLQDLWREQVIGYDKDAHAQLLQRIHQWALSLWEGFVDMITHAAMVDFMIALGVLAMAIEGVLIARHVRSRRKDPIAVARKKITRNLEFFRMLQSLLERMGMGIGTCQTCREQGSCREKALHLPGGSILDLMNFYYRLRWGGVTADATELQAARDKVVRLQQLIEARRKTST